MATRELDPCSIRLLFRRENEESGYTWYHAKNTNKASTYGKTVHLDLPPHSGKHENDETEIHDVRLVGVVEVKLRGHIDDQNNWSSIEEAVEELETNNEVYHYWLLEDRLNQKELEQLEQAQEEHTR